MEPVTAGAAAKIGLSLYEAGGLALLLLAIGVVGVSLMARFLMGMISALNERLTFVQDNQIKLLVGVVAENTNASKELREEIKQQTVVITQQNHAMRDRPCLQETGHHKAMTPLPHMRPA